MDKVDRGVEGGAGALPKGWLTGFGLLSAGVFGLGIVGGFRYQMHAEGELRKAGEGVKKVRSKPFSMVKDRVVPRVNPYVHASKALLAGSALCVGVGALATFGVGYAMNVSSLKEFGDVMSEWMPEQRRRVEQAFGIQPDAALARDREEIRGMSYDEEVQWWWKKKIEPHLDAAEGAGDGET